jgi:hypothetical protein
MGAPPFRIQDGGSHENMRSKVVPVRYREIVRTLQDNPDVLTRLVEIFYDCLADAIRLGMTLRGIPTKED